MSEVGNEMVVVYVRDGKERKSSGMIRSYADTKRNSNYGNARRTTDSDGNSHYSYHYDSDDHKNKTKVKVKNGKTSYTYHYDNDGGNNSYVSVDNNRNSGEDYESSKRDVEGMEVNLSEVSASNITSFADRHDLNLSANNNLTIARLNLAANENKGQFDLTFNISGKGDTEVDIFNEEGRNIYHYELEDFAGDFEDIVDLAQNGPGTYYLFIKQNGKSMAKELNLSRG